MAGMGIGMIVATSARGRFGAMVLNALMASICVEVRQGSEGGGSDYFEEVFG